MQRDRLIIAGSILLAGIAAFALAVSPKAIYVETVPGSVLLDATTNGEVHQLTASDGTVYRVWIDGQTFRLESPHYAGVWTLPGSERLQVGLQDSAESSDLARFTVLYAQDATGQTTDATTPVETPTPTSTPGPTPTPPGDEIALAGLQWTPDGNYGKTLSGLVYTDSTDTNIIWTAQLVVGEGDYTGRLRVLDAAGGIGVTWLVAGDTYQRLRRYDGPWPMFHLSPSANRPIPGGDLVTGTIPEAGKWYSFRVRISYEAQCVRFRARVWLESQTEPGEWEADATDCSASPVVTGALGVWSMGPGRKEWDDLTWTPATVPNPPTPVPTPTPLPDECQAFDTDGDDDVDLADYAGFVECFSGPK